ncbi:hypothetical protein [Aeoliella mucimassa]|uniref:Uncharacterized protein n=1 Tax=Aeoliella mucimassa TaxID=2527972 RepID=A0A518AHB2_9BACT|nr:hypothetical protein [Aeoliella mucimassa]QDU54113.1 hypothetical protein Pan181_02930 [Aeoliella mucimassa]
MDKFDDVTSWVREAGYYATPVEQLEDWDRVCLASKRRDGGGYTGNSFWVTFLANTWILGTWADRRYKFPDAGTLKSFCVQALSDHPNEVLAAIDAKIMRHSGITEISESELDDLIAASNGS